MTKLYESFSNPTPIIEKSKKKINIFICGKPIFVESNLFLYFHTTYRVLKKFEDIIQKNTKYLIKQLDIIIHCYFNLESIAYKI